MVLEEDKELSENYIEFIKEYKELIKKYTEFIREYKELIAKYKIPKEDKELIEKYIKHDITIYQFINCIPVAAISRGITIKLQADVIYINPDNLDEMVLFLDKKLHSATETHYSQSQAQQNTTNNEQIVPTNNSYNGTLTETVAPLSPHTNHFIQPTIATANKGTLTDT